MSRRTYYKSAQFSIPNESLGYSKFINELERKIEERSNSPDSQYTFPITQRSQVSKSLYAEELKRQMEEKSVQKALEREEKKKPAISESFHGYPNLPQTPRSIRRQRELGQMHQVSVDLTAQLVEKKQQVLSNKVSELESDKLSNKLDTMKYYDEKQEKIQKKEAEKQLLVSAWNQASKVKELQNVLELAERKGLKPVTVRSFDRENEGINSVIVKEEIKERADEEEKYEKEMEGVKSVEVYESINQSPRHRGNNREALKNKAMKLKEYIDSKNQGSYSYKIKQLVENAKQQRQISRNNIKQSFSPTFKHPYQNGKNIYNSQRTLKLK